ncbi:MAG: hypothetical protein L3J63_06305 [Geopsychrobacter sp.]|nr:hypothetical protein [Geopsychrobacter sp.]
MRIIFFTCVTLQKSTEQLTAQDLLLATDGMVAGYHALWQQPFPYGLEAGQQLFSAVLERPMRDLLNGLEALKSGSTPEMPLLVLDAEAELECFNHWVDELPGYERQGLRPETTHSCGLGSLAASFLLGWWFGRD